MSTEYHKWLTDDLDGRRMTIQDLKLFAMLTGTNLVFLMGETEEERTEGALHKWTLHYKFMVPVALTSQSTIKDAVSLINTLDPILMVGLLHSNSLRVVKIVPGVREMISLKLAQTTAKQAKLEWGNKVEWCAAGVLC